jgi:hypothetical protein
MTTIRGGGRRTVQTSCGTVTVRTGGKLKPEKAKGTKSTKTPKALSTRSKDLLQKTRVRNTDSQGSFSTACGSAPSRPAKPSRPSAPVRSSC